MIGLVFSSSSLKCGNAYNPLQERLGGQRGRSGRAHEVAVDVVDLTLTLAARIPTTPDDRRPPPTVLRGDPVRGEQVHGRVLRRRTLRPGPVPVLVELVTAKVAEVPAGPERGRDRVELVLLPLQGLKTGDQLPHGARPGEGGLGRGLRLPGAGEGVALGQLARPGNAKTGLAARVPTGLAVVGAVAVSLFVMLMLLLWFGTDEVLYNCG